jgi:hypothetical protein
MTWPERIIALLLLLLAIVAAAVAVIRFDLADVLNPAELESFEKEAEKAEASNLTEHFLNITLRPTSDPKEAA